MIVNATQDLLSKAGWQTISLRIRRSTNNPSQCQRPIRGAHGECIPADDADEPTQIYAEPIGVDLRVFLICEDQREKMTEVEKRGA